MSENKSTFEIKDELSLTDNLDGFSEALKELDAALAAILIPSLAAMSDGEDIERDNLLDALYMETHPSDGEAS